MSPDKKSDENVAMLFTADVLKVPVTVPLLEAVTVTVAVLPATKLPPKSSTVTAIGVASDATAVPST